MDLQHGEVILIIIIITRGICSTEHLWSRHRGRLRSKGFPLSSVIRPETVSRNVAFHMPSKF